MRGVMSLRKCEEHSAVYSLYIAYLGMLFYHFYLTFYSFFFCGTSYFQAAMVMFVGGTFVVIVPTPNGAGPLAFCRYHHDDAFMV